MHGRIVKPSSGPQLTQLVSFSRRLIFLKTTYFRNIDGVDLIITDETMPVITGTQLADHVREFDRKTPIIIDSGNLQALGDTENAYGRQRSPTLVRDR